MKKAIVIVVIFGILATCAHAQVPLSWTGDLTTTCATSANPCAGQTYPLTVQTGVYACYSNGYYGTDATAAAALGAQACTQEQLDATEEYTINDWCNIPFTYPSAFPAANLHGWDAKCCECIANALYATEPDYCMNVAGPGGVYVYGMFQVINAVGDAPGFINVGQGEGMCNPVNYFMTVAGLWANDQTVSPVWDSSYPMPLYNFSMWPQCSQCTNSNGGSCCAQSATATSTLLVAKNPLPKPVSGNNNTTVVAIAVSLSVAAVALIAVLVAVVVVLRRRRLREQQLQREQLAEPLVEEKDNENL